MSAHSRRRHNLRTSYSHTEPVVEIRRDPQTGRPQSAQIVARADRQGDGRIIAIRPLKKPEQVDARDYRGH